jgi:hypothetical protein
MKMLVAAYLQVLRRVCHMDRLNSIQDLILVFLLTCFIFTLACLAATHASRLQTTYSFCTPLPQ